MCMTGRVTSVLHDVIPRSSLCSCADAATDTHGPHVAAGTSYSCFCCCCNNCYNCFCCWLSSPHVDLPTAVLPVSAARCGASLPPCVLLPAPAVPQAQSCADAAARALTADACGPVRHCTGPAVPGAELPPAWYGAALPNEHALVPGSTSRNRTGSKDKGQSWLVQVQCRAVQTNKHPIVVTLLREKGTLRRRPTLRRHKQTLLIVHSAIL